jgi:hypothetical protein
MHEDDKNIISSAATGIAKSILYICLTVTGCFWISNCNLNQATIDSCQKSCSGIGTHMESVTNRECICVDSNSNRDNWVIP